MADAKDGDAKGSHDPPPAPPSPAEPKYIVYDEAEKEVKPEAEKEVKRGYVQEYAPVRDGIELRPKPTTDPLDPLNFPRHKKWVCLAIVMWMCKSRAPFLRLSVRHSWAILSSLRAGRLTTKKTGCSPT